MLVGSALYDKHETRLACIAQAKPYKMCMLHGFWACLARISSTFVAPKPVQCVKCGCYWQPKKCTCGLEHGQPAQRTTSQVIFDGFPWVLDPSWSQSSQNGVPIVQLMFLFEARARAPRTGTSSAQLGPHCWPLSVKLERTGSTKPTSQVTRT